MLKCTNCQTDLPSGARFCMNCGQPVGASSAADKAQLARLAAATPAPLVEKVRAAERLAGERRVVTALYVDVVGSTQLASLLGPQAWADVLSGMLDLAYPAIYRYEGTITRLQGDELLAFFGAPVAHENDPVRAVNAALDFLEGVRQYAVEVKKRWIADFAVRVSLSTGPVVIGPVNDQLAYEFSALGGPLSLVAEVEAVKAPMCVLITEYTHRFVAPFFESSPFTRVTINPPAGMNGEGLRQDTSIQLYRIEGRKPAVGQGRGLAGLRSAMVGRNAELATLLQLSRALQAGLGRAVAVLGEPGLGKSRLVSEWRSAVDAETSPSPIHWIEGRCLSYGYEQPYHLILALLRSLLCFQGDSQKPDAEPELRASLQGLIEELLPESERMEVYSYLGHLLSLKLDGEILERIRFLEPEAHLALGQAALRRLLRGLASRAPLAIVLEDLHWADASSVEFLRPILALASTERILFCLVMRSERKTPGWRLATAARDLLGGRFHEIVLDALTEGESRQLVSNLLEVEALPAQIRNLILRKAEGNPFFVEELIRMLIDHGAIFHQEGRWQAGAEIDNVVIPDNLQGLLQARIDRLPEDVKRTLRIAAVIGRQFPIKVLEHILSKEDI